MNAEKKIHKTDFLVIGSGIAGLSFALKTANHFKNATITIITKNEKNECNTKYAQGGISTVWDKTVDSFEQHIEDTLIAGAGVCDEEVVEFVVKEGHERLKELIEWGAHFDMQSSGLHLTKEGGHSEKRIVHHKDKTGLEIQKSLIKKIKTFSNISLLENYIDNYDFISGKDDLYNDSYIENFNDFLKSNTYDDSPVAFVDRGGANFDENGNETEGSNPNGATKNIAGISNAAKNVFGMMPHPERATSTVLGNIDGKKVFELLGLN